jgi:hypothetical protein
MENSKLRERFVEIIHLNYSLLKLNLLLPGLTGYPGSGPLSIVPDDKDTKKIEYRNILFTRDKRDKAFGSAEASGAASPELL